MKTRKDNSESPDAFEVRLERGACDMDGVRGRRGSFTYQTWPDERFEQAFERKVLRARREAAHELLKKQKEAQRKKKVEAEEQRWRRTIEGRLREGGPNSNLKCKEFVLLRG